MIGKNIRRLMAILLIIAALQAPLSRDAKAYCCLCTECISIGAMLGAAGSGLVADITAKVSTFFASNIIGTLTNGLFKGALQSMTMELVTAGQSLVPPIGAMLDGQAHINAIKEMQTLQAHTARDQMPSVAMCQFASLSKSIASADQQRNLTQEILSKRSLDRQLGLPGLVGAGGSTAQQSNLASRFAQYLTAYCDPNDENGILGEALGNKCAGPDNRINRDIDFTGLLQGDLTLNLDFTVPVDTEDETDIFNMEANLYSSDVVLRPKDNVLKNPDNRDNYLALRSLLAKKSVAENSFHALVALKTENQFSNTSYFEDMHRLTKGSYQDPAFYVTLYDNPANVLRQNAAMQGIGLMQQRDIFESQIRSEMLLSVLLETKLEQSSKDTIGGVK